ncbi:PREDICTED: protein BASIC PENTACYSTEINE2 [Tarenaya hassleriana]|uniref:protein BASIC PENTACYSTEINE2 n=1 Tax=Tarenaya hassleriana TaxID=28532 RepID=UPI00053C58F3|nr:PREDICTED: protein BASIC PENTACYSTEINE2 [Tarenaya hassleriana]
MDDDGFRNWGYYEPANFKFSLGLQFMPTVDRNTKPQLPGRDPNLMTGPDGPFHTRDYVVSETPIPMNYAWINQHKDKFFNMLPPNHGNMLPETSGSPSMQFLHPPLDVGNRVEENPIPDDEEIAQAKKRKPGGDSKGTKKRKKPWKQKDGNGNESNERVKRVRQAKKSAVDVVINGVSMDISGLPVPVCTCSGSPQQCYRWGCGGWQSACCTTNISVYPLPMSMKRRGARISGRKMSQGAFKKVLEKLVAQGFDFWNPIDLRSRWARHGTNKFVTIR